MGVHPLTFGPSTTSHKSKDLCSEPNQLLVFHKPATLTNVIVVVKIFVKMFTQNQNINYVRKSK